MVRFIKSKIKDVKFGRNVTIIEPVNLYGCYIGNNSFIGPFVEIQNNAYIGNNCRIQSHTFICENVTIKNNCFIGHGVMFINDKFTNNKLVKKKNFLLKTTLEDNVLIGSNSTILPVVIKKRTVIGAGSVVTKDCKKNSIYSGNPAKLKNKKK